ncbi:MAG: LysM peptidoglycan-binding domain-containing protein, partial [Pseudomonadota bacterium]
LPTPSATPASPPQIPTSAETDAPRPDRVAADAADVATAPQAASDHAADAASLSEHAALPPAAPTAPIVLRVGPDGAVAPAAPQAPVAAVTLDAISYAEDGAVVISGRGRPGHAVRVLADGALVAETVIGEGGGWRIEASSLLPGRVYRLTVQEIDGGGRRVAQVETPFRREAPEALAAAAAAAAQAETRGGAAAAGPGSIVVQPGASLWRIAQTRYGEGVLYTVIFAANRDSIDDPNLIYPGQIFALPDR